MRHSTYNSELYITAAHQFHYCVSQKAFLANFEKNFGSRENNNLLKDMQIVLRTLKLLSYQVHIKVSVLNWHVVRKLQYTLHLGNTKESPLHGFPRKKEAIMYVCSTDRVQYPCSSVNSE